MEPLVDLIAELDELHSRPPATTAREAAIRYQEAIAIEGRATTLRAEATRDLLRFNRTQCPDTQDTVRTDTPSLKGGVLSVVRDQVKEDHA